MERWCSVWIFSHCLVLKPEILLFLLSASISASVLLSDNTSACHGLVKGVDWSLVLKDLKLLNIFFRGLHVCVSSETWQMIESVSRLPWPDTPPPIRHVYALCMLVCEFIIVEVLGIERMTGPQAWNTYSVCTDLSNDPYLGFKPCAPVSR